MKQKFKRLVKSALEKSKDLNSGEILNESDLLHLPETVKKYIRFSGAVGREKVKNFRAVFSGGIRSSSSEEFMPLKSVQYNFISDPERIFYIVAVKKGIPAKGIHHYAGKKASMVIKLLGLFKLIEAYGPEMDQSETVTFFNDICFMAPAALTDKNITWGKEDGLSVEASYTNGHITVKSTLFFAEDGRLVDFISHDRYESKSGKSFEKYPWLTPATSYREVNGFRLPAKAKLIYRHPDEDFCYGEFELENVEYNVDAYR